MNRTFRSFAILAWASMALGAARADVPPRPVPAPVPPPDPMPPLPSPTPDPRPIPAAPITGPAAPSLPDPASAGAAKAVTFDFEGLPKDVALPAGFVGLDGHWSVIHDEQTKLPVSVLHQDRHVDEYAVVLATGEGRAFGDATATVRFRPESGDEDASGGIVFRATDAKNYGLARANANEGNFRLYTVHNGFRRQIASVDVETPTLNEWHTIAVTFVGNTFTATLDGKDKIEATNDTLSAGWCGLWTKADSVTSFDDFKLEPEVKKVHTADEPPVPTGK